MLISLGKYWVSPKAVSLVEPMANPLSACIVHFHDNVGPIRIDQQADVVANALNQSELTEAFNAQKTQDTPPAP